MAASSSRGPRPPGRRFRPLRKPKWFAYLQTHRPLAVVGLGWVAFLLVLAVSAPLLASDTTPDANRQLVELGLQPPGSATWVWYSPQTARHYPLQETATGSADFQAQNGEVRFRVVGGLTITQKVAPSALEPPKRVVFWFGTDLYGRDLLSRLLLGARVSLGVGILAVLISLAVGGTLGALAGFIGGWPDRALQFLMTLVWAVPTLLLAIAIAFAVGRGFLTLALAIGLTTWVELARILRGQVLSLRTREFVLAGRAMGYSSVRLLRRHVLPNLWGPILIVAVSNFSTAVLLEAGLSFLGLGVQSPTPSWGQMLYQGYQYLLLENGYWLALFPAGALVLLILSLNLIALGLRDALSPVAE